MGVFITIYIYIYIYIYDTLYRNIDVPRSCGTHNVCSLRSTVKPKAYYEDICSDLLCDHQPTTMITRKWAAQCVKKWIFCITIQISLKSVPKAPTDRKCQDNWWYVSVGLSKGLAPNRRWETITQTKADQVSMSPHNVNGPQRFKAMQYDHLIQHTHVDITH